MLILCNLGRRRSLPTFSWLYRQVCRCCMHTSDIRGNGNPHLAPHRKYPTRYATEVEREAEADTESQRKHNSVISAVCSGLRMMNKGGEKPEKITTEKRYGKMLNSSFAHYALRTDAHASFRNSTYKYKLSIKNTTVNMSIISALFDIESLWQT